MTPFKNRPLREKILFVLGAGGGLLIFLALFHIFDRASRGTEKIPLAVVLDWYPNPNHMSLVIASQKGFFAEEGLDVRLQPPSAQSSPRALVAAGKIPLALDMGENFPRHIQEVDNIVRIGTLIDQPQNAVLSREPLKSFADLKGKTLGVANDPRNKMLLFLMRESGLKDGDIRIVNLHWGLNEAMLTKKVDAVMDVARNVEPFELKDKGLTTHLLYPEKMGWPAYESLIVITNRESLADKAVKQTFRKFLAAVDKATAWIKAHPKDAWGVYAQAYPQQNAPAIEEAFAATVAMLADRAAEAHLGVYEKLQAFFLAQGFMEGPALLEDHVVDITH